MRTGKELADMIERIPDETVGKEIKVYFQQSTGISETRWVMEEFLQFYVRRQP